jgi:NAD(P)H-hydrate epimerase
MLILDAQAIRTCDAYTIEKEGITSYQLMERAAAACVQWLLQHGGYQHPFLILCGSGNNGGDGLVIARLLHLAGLPVQVLLAQAENYSTDNRAAQDSLIAAGITPARFEKAEQIPVPEPGTFVIDALFGNGINRPLEGEALHWIRRMNQFAQARIVSIDLPSGFSGEQTMPECVQADITLCFQRPRLQFFFFENEFRIGFWELIDIGLQLPPKLIQQQALPDYHYVQQRDVQALLLGRRRFTHKGEQGRVLLAGGSAQTAGAILLSARAALRSGAGLVHVFGPETLRMALLIQATEALFHRSAEPEHLAGFPNSEAFQAVGFGPGAGLHDDTARSFKLGLQNATQPWVIDADGLNLLAEHPTWLEFIPKGSILTPHPGELDRLTSPSNSGAERWQKAMELSRKTGAIVVLKGAFTAVCVPDGSCTFNSTGNPGMACGGSGDVLTGLLAGLLAQGYTSKAAAIVGVYLHGKAGDLAAEAYGMEALKAGDLIDFLPQAWKSLKG